MTLPHATHAGRRDREPALPQLVGDADLAESRLLDGNRGVFDLLCDAVFQHWLLAADLLQRQLAAFVVKLLRGRSCRGYNPSSCRLGSHCQAAWQAPRARPWRG